jgi:hypothetical protein
MAAALLAPDESSSTTIDLLNEATTLEAYPDNNCTPAITQPSQNIAQHSIDSTTLFKGLQWVFGGQI